MLAIDLYSTAVLERKPIRSGVRFETTEHHVLGTMTDYFFDEATGVLEGYEVTGGIFAEDPHEHGFLPASRILSITKDVVLVPAHTAAAMREKPGGLPALLERLQKHITAEGPITQDELNHYLLSHVEGLRVRQSMWLTNGVMLAARGQITNAALITRAQRHQAALPFFKAIGIDLDELLP
jgi:hypothetical protein